MRISELEEYLKSIKDEYGDIGIWIWYHNRPDNKPYLGDPNPHLVSCPPEKSERWNNHVFVEMGGVI